MSVLLQPWRRPGYGTTCWRKHETQNKYKYAQMAAFVSLETADIVYIESLGNYIKIHTPLKNYRAVMTLNELEQVLPAKKFARIHKSYVINMDFITAVTAAEVFINEKKLPIGRTFKKLLLMKMEG